MTLYIWRHPKPINVQGVFLGHTDARVNPRKIKRLANHIERYAKLNGLPKEIWVSHLQRSRLVGEKLAERGWTCRVDPRLAELNFGTWDGRSWQDIGQQTFDEWIDNFAHYNFSNDHTKGESVHELFVRVNSFIEDVLLSQSQNKPVLAVAHAGLINAAKSISEGESVPEQAKDWPTLVGYRQLSVLDFQ